MNNKKSYLLIIVVVLVIIAIVYLESIKPKIPGGDNLNNAKDTTMKNSEYQKAPELIGVSGYINTNNNLTIESLRGKVVIIDFWTYSCINCIRTIPYLNAWHDKYVDEGLVIIGIHTPEFSFEKDFDNVKMAVDNYNIKFPVVLDNDYFTWRSYKNSYWPRKYLIDKDGYIRYDHIGEGGYDETEKQIQELLAESGSIVNDSLVNIAEQTPTTKNTKETYLGYSFAKPRGQDIGNGGFKQQESYNYSSPIDIKNDVVYLEGIWLAESEYLESSNNSIIYLKFTAKTVNIVLEGTGMVEVYIDNNLITKDVSGISVIDGKSLIDESRLYEVYNGPYSTHLLKLVFTENIKAHAFTFG